MSMKLISEMAGCARRVVLGGGYLQHSHRLVHPVGIGQPASRVPRKLSGRAGRSTKAVLGRFGQLHGLDKLPTASKSCTCSPGGVVVVRFFLRKDSSIFATWLSSFRALQKLYPQA